MTRWFTLPAALSLALSGCAYHRLIVANPNPEGSLKAVDSNAFGLGAVQRRTVADCPTNLIDEVRFRQSFAEALATVVTLGLWAPARIEYRCAKTPTEEGTTDGP
jgi:hypothetical protein